MIWRQVPAPNQSLSRQDQPLRHAEYGDLWF